MNRFLDGMAAASDPCVSSDGSRVAVAVSRVNVGDDRYDREIWLVDASGSRQFTAGPGDTTPRFSPDGNRLAFVRTVDGRPQLAVIPVDGGEAVVLTEFDVGVTGAPAWSPDGSSIAVTASVWTEEWADIGDEERQRKPRRIQRRDYRSDGVGWTHDKRRHVYLVDAATGDSRRVSRLDANEASPAFSPDGSAVALLSEDSDHPGYRFGSSVWEIEVATGEGSQIGPTGVWEKLSYRPDGVPHALGSAGPEFPELGSLWRLQGTATQVSPQFERALVAVGTGPPSVVWEEDVAVVTVVDSGAVGTARIGPDGSVSDVDVARTVVTGFDASGGVFAATVSAVDEPGRLEVTSGTELVTLADFGGRTVETIQPEHFVVECDGYDLDVWVYLPAGDQVVPLLLNIHGGPASQYGWGYFDEFQVYAEAGYGVVATNPRGSAGRDREFLRAVVGDGWGKVDLEDIDRVVAAALERYPRFDADRLGVMGGSYGGFLTAWLIAHQNRWKTAIVERALLSWPSFGGTSDIGGWFGTSYIGDQALEWERSPLRLADRIDTPTLILHSEDDFRCPIEQAEQLFNVLAGRGVETEFVRFPGEGHELSRAGSPRHRLERFEIILDWLSSTL